MGSSHGGPIHIGEPEKLGIKDIKKPDFGDYVHPLEDDILVFWACGVTSILAAICTATGN